MAKAVLYDSVLCVGCRLCEAACSEKWKLPYTDEIAATEKTSALKLTTVTTHGDHFSRKLCMHCIDPACASVCPVAALQKTDAGPVVYHEDLCMGCRYCLMACPYQVPSYQWNARLPLVKKCDMCAERVSFGGITHCSEACPTEATITGERDELIQIAKDRMAASPDDYHPEIYGLKEAGGTSVLMIGAVPFTKLNMPSTVPNEALPDYTWAALKYVPDVVVMGTVLLGGIYWISHRREEVAAAEGGEQ